jgi:Reverse transcriptase (RNA-dependent DNA polymerase)
VKESASSKPTRHLPTHLINSTITAPHLSLRLHCSSLFDGFSFQLVKETNVLATTMSISFGASVPTLLLTHVFNYVIMTSSFASFWKVRLVVPRPKSHGASQLADFRPMSILPVLLKITEKLMFDQMACYIEDNSLLFSFQSDFRKFHSTATALTKIFDDIPLVIERDGFSVTVLLDFSKAFDSMSHDLLFIKLKNRFGLSGTACRLVVSFLQDRMQRMTVGDS